VKRPQKIYTQPYRGGRADWIRFRRHHGAVGAARAGLTKEYTMITRRSLILCLAVLVMASAAFPAFSADKPVPVTVGVYINQIFDLSLKDNKLSVDFWIWFRWKDQNIDPLKTFEIVSGRKDSQNDNATVFRKETGEYYASSRVVATIDKFWDISRFPLDNHLLTIGVEDNTYDTSALIYVPDVKNSGLEPAVQVPGFTVGEQKSMVADHVYQTSYGDPALPSGNKTSYSRFEFAVHILRPGIGYFVKMFFTVFIATLIALMCLFIKPTDLDPRFGLGAGALFAAVASEMVIASSLPDTNIITLPDKLHIIAIFFIFASLAESIVSLRVFCSGKEELSRKIDKTSLAAFLAAYLVLSAICIVVP
jgi:hypothetical protein